MLSDTDLYIQEMRLRCAPGHPNPPSTEEYKKLIELMRQGRAAIPAATGGSKTKKAPASAKINSDDLLSELEGL